MVIPFMGGWGGGGGGLSLTQGAKGCCHGSTGEYMYMYILVPVRWLVSPNHNWLCD